MAAERCTHRALITCSSSHAAEANYRRPTEQQRAAATTASGRTPPAQNSSKLKDATIKLPSESLFTAPLILPNDDLALDPSYPPQSVRSWLRDKDRNTVTPEKNIVYIAAPPETSPDVRFIDSWCHTISPGGSQQSEDNPPSVHDVASYLGAFYHGLQVKVLANPLRFASWDDGKTKAKAPSRPSFIGLATSTECVRIRTRPSADGVYPRQLNLDDLLDAAIEVLPGDAYALLLLVHHDLYEDEDDDFVCGRAYGGSRVAVVSSARYNPSLDQQQNVERLHAWPASHCEAYVQACCAAAKEESGPPRKRKKAPLTADSDGDTAALGPLQAAVSAQNSLPPLQDASSPKALSDLWLGRVCRTASHELGHCFGIDHCVYYACIMQGSGSLAEDPRQPPYLCPVDLAKLLRATGTTAESRYNALLAICEEHKDVHVFASFAAWIRAVLHGMDSS